MAAKTKPTYKFCKGTTFKGLKAQEAGEHLEAMRVSHGGRLTPQSVVEEASSPGSPIHKAFTWDDTKAAHDHRVWQARQLIGHITVEYEDRPITERVRAFANVTIDKCQYYDSMRVVVDDPAKRQQILADAMREIDSWRRRYAAIEELAGIRQAIADVKLRQPVEAERPAGLAEVRVG